MDKTFIYNVSQDPHLSLQPVRVANFSFQRLRLKESLEFVPGFTHMRDVEKGFIPMSNKNFIVWPVREDSSSERLMLIHAHSDQSFDKFKDFAIFEAISKAFLHAYRLLIEIKASQKNNERSLEILDTCKPPPLLCNHLCVVKLLMAETRHVGLCVKLIELLPKLYRFKACGVMFYDHKTDDLFSIQLNQEEQGSRTKEYDNVVKYPKENGCTGTAIKLNKPVFFTKGQAKPKSFAEDIDNIVGATAIESMIVYPIVYEGKLHGVI